MSDDFSLGKPVEYKSKDKAVNKGGTELFKKNEWIGTEDINDEEKILLSPLMHESFERILDKHEPIQHTAFLSLCTASRPYDKSTKWKGFIDAFHKKVDFIVVSNGGMIPEKFWEQYPYMTYDGGDHWDIEMYQYIMFYRMLRFFKRHSYKYVIANFRPNLINHEPAHKALHLLKSLGYIEDYEVIPDQETYDIAQEKGFRPPHGCGDMFPDLTQTVLDKLKEQVEEYGYDEDKLPKKPENVSDWE